MTLRKACQTVLTDNLARSQSHLYILYKVLVLLLTVYHYIFHLAVLNQLSIKGFLLILHIDIFESEIQQAIFLTLAYIKEVLTVHLDIADGDIIAL